MDSWLRRSLAVGRGQRGIALPLAMVMLVTIMALMAAFAVLAQTEPLIASNQDGTARARSLADSGVERAVWALTNSTTVPGGATAATTPLAAPYNGATMFAVNGNGGFTLQITPGPNAPLDQTVTSVGWVPGAVANTNSHQKAQVVLAAPPPPLNPPCAICVAGSTQVAGNSTITSSANGCNGGAPPPLAVMSSQTTSVTGSASVTGFGTSGATAYQSGSNSNDFLYKSSTIAQLKAMAQANGTYFRGAVTASNMPTGGGVIFIDTVDGTPFTSTTTDANAGSLTLNGNATYKGIIVVAGSANLSGAITINGLMYVQNDITISGNVTVNGAVASENRKDTSSTNIDSETTGSVVVRYNCDNVANGGGTVNLPKTWMVSPGSYTYIAGQ